MCIPSKEKVTLLGIVDSKVLLEELDSAEEYTVLIADQKFQTCSHFKSMEDNHLEEVSSLSYSRLCSSMFSGLRSVCIRLRS